jgi:large subunit ribosomal protein L30e
MSKVLQKALKESIKEDKCILGMKQVIDSLKDSKMIVMSESIANDEKKNIIDIAEKDKIPTVQFKGTSVALGRLCGLQFRVSIVSFKSLAESNVRSILNEEKQTKD